MMADGRSSTGTGPSLVSSHPLATARLPSSTTHSPSPQSHPLEPSDSSPKLISIHHVDIVPTADAFAAVVVPARLVRSSSSDVGRDDGSDELEKPNLAQTVQGPRVLVR